MSDAAAAAPAATAAPAPSRAWARWLELAALLGGLLYSLIFWVRLPTQLPSDADYAALQAALQRDARPGDGAAVLPFWADHAKVFLHGIPVLGLPSLDSELDAERYARLWVVAQPALPHSDARDSLAALAQRLDADPKVQHFGPLELWLFTPRAGRAATWDFVAHAQDAQVQSNGPVQLEWREFDFLPRHCFLVGSGQALFHFPAVAMTHGLRIGLGGAPAQVIASVDGRQLPPVVPAGTTAFQERELAVDGLAAGEHVVDLDVRGHGACVDAVAY